MLTLPTKDPNEVLDYTIDWSERLLGDTIAGAPTITVTGATKDGQSNTDSSVSFKLSGGTAGTMALVTALGVTTGGRTIEDTAALWIGSDPISLAGARAQCEIDADSSDHDAVLAVYLRAAVEHVEAVCGIRVTPRTASLQLACFGEADRLPLAPIQSITEIRYLDSVGAEQLLDPATYALINLGGDALRPALRLQPTKSWPATYAAPDAVRITAVAGYAVCPEPVRQAMLLIIGDWFRTREDTMVGTSVSAMPNASAALLTNYRTFL